MPTGARIPRLVCRLAALPILAAGCASFGNSEEFRPESFQGDPEWLYATNFPLVSQEGRSDCGAAALSAVLSYWTLPGTPDEIRRACPASESGIRAGDLRAFARSRGLKAFLVEGSDADLENELGRRRPVLVGLAVVEGDTALTHYEVVVGLHRRERRVVTMDPARGWREWRWSEFDRLWSPARHLALVCFKTEE